MKKEEKWNHRAIISNGRVFQEKFFLLGYNIWDYEWIKDKGNKNSMVVNPHDGKKYELNIVKIKVRKNQFIRFGYILLKENSRHKYFDYGIYLHDDDMEWVLKTLERKEFFISGENIWEYRWFDVGRVKIKDPFHHQKIELDIVNIYANGNRISFGIYEAGQGNQALFEKKLKGKERKVSFWKRFLKIETW